MIWGAVTEETEVTFANGSKLRFPTYWKAVEHLASIHPGVIFKNRDYPLHGEDAYFCEYDEITKETKPSATVMYVDYTPRHPWVMG